MKLADIQPWCAYLAPHCRHTTDRSNKYVVIVHVDENALGFFINSRLTQWIKDRPRLLVCNSPIFLKENEHVVDYDSFIDCQKIYEFGEHDIEKKLDKISDRAKSDMLKAIDDCPVLERRYKKLILSKEGYPGYE